MAARKKIPAKATPTEAAFLVVLEDMRSKFDVFGEAVQGIGEKLERFREDVTEKFAQVDRRFDEVDRRFEQIDRRFEQIDSRFEQIDRRFERVELAVLENSREIRGLQGELGEVRSTVTRIETALATKANRDEVESIVLGVVAGG